MIVKFNRHREGLVLHRVQLLICTEESHSWLGTVRSESQVLYLGYRKANVDVTLS